MKITIWATSMLAIILSAAMSIADGSGRITGHVFDSYSQSPVAGATVVVDGTQFRAQTGNDGAYTINNIPAGVYILRVDKTSAMQRVAVAAGQTVTADFRLSGSQNGPSAPESAV
ncbi:MAG TPA: carboxypeptidase regulatory-like domain-containing protein, partial [Candidatus Krumholzibacteria bacterium]|nr:carboxypeptidase regulatory-like domain-containing protein [Candidatus Krumholzibacteria bacterium]